MNLLLTLLVALAGAASAQTRTTGDATVTGAMGAGTLMPRAALEVGMQAGDEYALKVSSPDGASLLLLDRSAKAGLGLNPGGARLDVIGRGDAGEVGLELRAGNSTSAVSSAQAAFGSETGAYRHSIRSRATGAQAERNSLDFYLWTSADAVYALGSTFALSLQSSATANQGGVHVSPTTHTATVQLAVSSGTVYAGGIILGYADGAPCFAALKADLRRLGEDERQAAVRDLKALRPAAFRYKGDRQRRQGYVYEEAPASVRGGQGAVVVDERLMNLELALQAAQGHIKGLEAELAGLEGRRQ